MAKDIWTSMRTDFALDALEQALYDRETVGQLIHHSDRGCEYLSITYSERLAVAGIEPSVGSRGDSYDNALAETIIGLFRTEVIHHRGPWKGMEDVEFATPCWVSWYNTERLMEPLGYLPPAEYEAQSLRALSSDLVEGGLNDLSLRKTRGGSVRGCQWEEARGRARDYRS